MPTKKCNHEKLDCPFQANATEWVENMKDPLGGFIEREFISCDAVPCIWTYELWRRREACLKMQRDFDSRERERKNAS